MKITKNKVVLLTYELAIKSAEESEFELVETTDDAEPMGYIQGMSGYPERFEKELEGLQPGDTFDFSISAEEGYGQRDPEAVVDLPLEVFKVNGEVDKEMLQAGNVLPMTNEEGHHLNGRIIQVSDESVWMDFNHPLAEMELHFKGKVISVRDATPTELSHGHVHGEGGVHHH
ncbi:MAG: peptidylprolyl isomerase [Siphonobacter sp.]